MSYIHHESQFNFPYYQLRNLCVGCRVNVSRVDHLSWSLRTANDSTYSAQAEPEASTKHQKQDKES